jgi:hypothetical protein
VGLTRRSSTTSRVRSVKMRDSRTERTNPLSGLESATLRGHPVMSVKMGCLTGLSPYRADSHRITCRFGASRLVRTYVFRSEKRVFASPNGSSARSCRRPVLAATVFGPCLRRRGTDVGLDSRLRAPLREGGGNDDLRSSIFAFGLMPAKLHGRLVLAQPTGPYHAGPEPEARREPPPSPPHIAQNEANRSFRINKTMRKIAKNEAKRTQTKPKRTQGGIEQAL